MDDFSIPFDKFTTTLYVLKKDLVTYSLHNQDITKRGYLKKSLNLYSNLVF